MTPLDAPMALRARADGDPKLVDDRPQHREVFLILRETTRRRRTCPPHDGHWSGSGASCVTSMRRGGRRYAGRAACAICSWRISVSSFNAIANTDSQQPVAGLMSSALSILVCGDIGRLRRPSPPASTRHRRPRIARHRPAEAAAVKGQGPQDTGFAIVGQDLALQESPRPATP